VNQYFSILAYADNWIVWAILALALTCYVLIFDCLLARRDPEWRLRVASWIKVLPVLLGLLPLLGLLGTINGLLSTFRTLSISGGIDQQTLLSSGIADAMITTQLGLVMVIPGFILFARLKAAYRARESDAT
jgi:biopolymer transport protein ExbB